MSLFCLLYIPLLYLLRRFGKGASSVKGEIIWALPLGAAAVIARYLFGSLVTPLSFGFPRWMSGLVDIVGLPVLLALAACGALVILRVFPRDTDYAGFALLWLIPPAAVQTISNSPHDPISQILVPLLWSAQAVGIPFCINTMTRNPRWHIVFLMTLAIAALPIAAVSSWWAFFTQQTWLGVMLLAVTLVPAVISMIGNREQKTEYSEHGDSNYLQILDN